MFKAGHFTFDFGVYNTNKSLYLPFDTTKIHLEGFCTIKKIAGFNIEYININHRLFFRIQSAFLFTVKTTFTYKIDRTTEVNALSFTLKE